MKKQVLILGAILLTTILILPSLLVMPYAEASSEVEEQSKDQVIEAAVEEEGMTVAVLRNETEEIEEVPIEEYVARIVASEMPADFEMEALKAQALAARTYIVKKMLHQNEESYDVTDTVDHQVYKSIDELRDQWGLEFSNKYQKIEEAVAATRGQILTYEGVPIDATFFSTSNGYTENAEDYWENEIPYLRSVTSPWDTSSPEYMDQEILTKEEVAERLELSSTHDLTISNIRRTSSGRIQELSINGKTFTGRQVREDLGLRSSDFSIEIKDDHIIFTTRGYGHGVGMSQYGANGMAKEGSTYQEIVNHYYKDIDIQTIEEVS